MAVPGGQPRTVKVRAHTRTVKPRKPPSAVQASRTAAKGYASQGAQVEAAAFLAAPRAQRAAMVHAARHHVNQTLAETKSAVRAGKVTSQQGAVDFYRAARKQTPGESVILGIHGMRTSAHTRTHNRQVAPEKNYATNTPAVIPHVNVMPESLKKEIGFQDFANYQKRAMKGKVGKNELAMAKKVTSVGVKPAWFKGASAGTLFALQQMLRPSSALGAAQLNRSAKGGSSIGSRAAAAWEGFKHPDEHAGDWVKAAKAQHWPVPVVSGTAASIAADPLTYVAPGVGTAAKEAALKTYGEVLARETEKHLAAGLDHVGATHLARPTAVAAARKVWEDAPAHARVPGLKLKVNAGVPFSRKLRINVATKPMTAQGRVKVLANKVGIHKPTEGFGSGHRMRSMLRSVAPSVRPILANGKVMDPLDFALARRAGAAGRAGERSAKRLAEHRLHAYHKVAGDMPLERQHAIRVAVQDAPHISTPQQRAAIWAQHGLNPAESAVAEEHAIDRYAQYASEPGRAPLTADSRMGWVEPPRAPAYQGSDVAASSRELGSARAARHAAERTGTPADLKKEVESARNAVKTAHKALGAAHGRRAMQELHTGSNAVESLGQTVARARLAQAQERLKAAGAAARLGTTAERQAARVASHARLRTAEQAHRGEVAAARADRKAYRGHIQNVQAYQNAPKGYVHMPEDITQYEPGALNRQATGGGDRAGGASYHRQGGGKLADMTPEQLAKREQRIPVIQAHRALEHGRILNAVNVNNWIASLGRAVSHSDAAQLAGKNARLFAKDDRGFTPLFNRHGTVDGDKLNAATRAGHDIVQVDQGTDDVVRGLARGNRPAAGDSGATALTGDPAVDQGTWKQLTRTMKIGQTQINPSYHIRNFIGDSYNAMLAGTTGGDYVKANRLLRMHAKERKLERVLSQTPEGKQAFASLSKARRNVHKYAGVPGGKASDLEVLMMAAQHGAIDTGINQAELMAVRSGTDMADQTLRRRFMDGLARAGDRRENTVRLATFHGALKRGMTPDEAAQWSLTHHFDYADLSKTEQTYLRGVFPFWTFMARNTPLQVKSLVTRPGIHANVEKLRRASLTAAGMPQNASSGDEPFEQTNLKWGTPFKAGKYPITWAPGLSNMDLSNVPLGIDRMSRAQAAGNVLGRIHPILGTGVLGGLAGLNAMNLSPLKPWVPAPSWWPADAPGPLQRKRVKINGVEQWGVSGTAMQALQILPMLSTASKFGQAPPNPSKDQPTPFKLRSLGLLTGGRTAVENPHQRAINQYFDRIDQITTELNRLRPQDLHHKPGEPYPKNSKIGKLNAEMADKLARIYYHSKKMGAKQPLGAPRGKGRARGGKLGGGFGGKLGGALGGGGLHP